MPAIPISKTKIVVPPRRAELLARPRLLENLAGLLDRKLILLTAPAGYGKTSLLIDLAHSTYLPVCWFSLDPLDRDPQRFMAYLIAALTEKFAGLEAPMRAQLDQLKSIETDAEPLLIALTNELYDQVEQDFLLIIDDYHLLEEAPLIPVLLNRFLQLADENCHVLLASRTPAALPDFPLMVAREQVDGLNHTELAFNPQEVQLLFQQNYQQHLSDASASEMVQRTGGWITGMLLANRPGVAQIAGADTFSFLGQQVLDQQPPQLREFLLRTSIPDEFDAGVCAAILASFESASQDCQSLMKQVLEKNLFVLPVGEGGRWLRYHPLFREFLQARLKEERPQELRPILEHLGRYHENHGEWERAYATCQSLQDPQALASVVERAGPSLVRHALVTLESWINALPPFIVRERPGLASLRGMIAAMKGDVQQGLQYYGEAESAYREKKDHAGLALTLIRRATARRFKGDYQGALDDVEEALRLAEPDPELQAQFAEGLRLRGVVFFRLGQPRQAIEPLERSLSLYTALRQDENIPILLMDTGITYAATGDFQAARAYLSRALDIWRAESNLQWLPVLYNNMGAVYHQLGEYEQASTAFENGLSTAARSRNRRTESLILAGLGDLYAEVQEYQTAAQAYHRAQALAVETDDSFALAYLVLARALLAIRQNAPARASELLEQNDHALQGSSSLYERGLLCLVQGRMRLLENMPAEAVALLRRAKDAFADGGRVLEGMWSQVWLAAALNLAGQKDSARSEMLELLPPPPQNQHAFLVTLHEASPWLGSLRADSEIGRSLNSMFEKAARLAAELPETRRALRHLAQSFEMPSAGIRIQAFGRPEVIVMGKAIPISVWQTQSVRDLFFYFLHRRKPLTREQIGAVLWPETDEPKALQIRFKNEMYRLRRTVGKDAIIFDDEYYRLNPALDFEYDAEIFEKRVARGRQAGGEEERIQHFQKAVDLVSGPFLADVNYDWAAAERQRLDQMYHAVLEDLAAAYLNTRRPQEAISICQRALAAEPSRESMYQLAMRAHFALGDRAAIVRAFQACEKALHNLGFSPSEETRQLYLQLTSG